MPRRKTTGDTPAATGLQTATPEPVRRAPPVRSRRQDVDLTDTHQGRARAMKSTGPARDSLDESAIEVPAQLPSMDKLAALAFMEEMVTVVVHESTDPGSDPLPMVSNGGDKNRQYFVRGLEQTVKRRYVEVLARSRVTKFVQEKYTDVQGNESYRYNPRSVPQFPFSVLQDTPRGKAYWKAIEAAYRAEAH